MPAVNDAPEMASVNFIGFDVFGTIVDWRSGVAREAEPFLKLHGLNIDALQFADEWRSLYQPAMESVRSGTRPWVKLSVLNRENLDAVLIKHGVGENGVPAAARDQLNGVWERLDPWPDVVEGLTRLKQRFAIGPLSNSHIAGMLNLARFGRLPWDVIVGAEISKSYKPQPQTYLMSAEAVGQHPRNVAMAAAHNGDLHAAMATGFRTIFIKRPQEHGPQQTTDLSATGSWDIIAGSLIEVADALNC